MTHICIFYYFVEILAAIWTWPTNHWSPSFILWMHTEQYQCISWEGGSLRLHSHWYKYH